MTAQSMKLELVEILKDIGKGNLSYVLRYLLLDYIADNAKGGLPHMLEEYLPALNQLISFIESIEEDDDDT